MLDDHAISGGGDPRIRETGRGGDALVTRETDPERIAFNLWNEGRVDEAIAFLEREIAARKERERRTLDDGLPSACPNGWDATLEPVSDWRERHRTALSSPDFNAFGTTAPMIDITPTPADAIVPPKRRRSRRAAWTMGLGFAVLGAAAGAALWSGNDDMRGAAIVSTEPMVQVEPAAPALAALPEPEAEIASLEEADVVETPPPEAEIADVPVLENDPAMDQTDSAPVEPESTASIGAPPAEAETSDAPPVIVEARLPRERPDYQPPQASAAEPSVSVIEPGVPFGALPPAGAPLFAQPYPRLTLTPAEHQALLERRAWALDYAARRRALAEGRPVVVGPPVLFDVRRASPW